VAAGTRGIVQDVDLWRLNDDIYVVGFPESERLTGKTAWLREIDLFAAQPVMQTQPHQPSSRSAL
jgi:hypothetical protein